jgi:transaldolase
VDPARVLIKIAATWEGIQAASVLEKDGIACNLTLMFGLHQAVGCAQANITLISPFVGRILDWHKAKHGVDSYAPEDDPGVQSVTEIYNYYKHFDHNTEIMGASFRNMAQITQLAGCDLLTIGPKFLKELQSEGSLTRKLNGPQAKAMQIQRIDINEQSFRSMHEADEMSKEKLHEGIVKFSQAIDELEATLLERL